MASFTNIGRAIPERSNVWNLSRTVVRCMSGSRNEDRSCRPLTARTDLAEDSSNASNQLAPFCPLSFKGEVGNKKPAETSAIAEEDTPRKIVGPLFGKRLKRSSETIRHDKLYLQSTTDFSKREYVKTWTDFQDKRSIPITEWGKRFAD